MDRPVARIAALPAALLLVLAGCGDDASDSTSAQDPIPTPVVTSEGTPSVESSSSADATASEDEPAIQVIEINLEDGKPTEKVGPTVTVGKGDKLTLVISADADQEIHVHGLDAYIEVPAGETVTKTLTVSLAAGSYEVEVHETGTLLFNLQVK